MTETTTIQVRKDQAEQLKEIARENGNYKTVIDRVLEGYNDTTGPQEMDVDRIINRIEDLESQLPRKVAEELQR